MKLSITALLLMAFLSSFGQTQKEKLEERQNNKVEMFTSKENDNLQFFYAAQVDKMKLSEDLKEEYYGILLYYTNKMGRLGDKDKAYTDKEQKTKFDAMVVELNNDVKVFLTQEQNLIHQESSGEIVNSVYNRKSWSK